MAGFSLDYTELLNNESLRYAKNYLSKKVVRSPYLEICEKKIENYFSLTS